MNRVAFHSSMALAVVASLSAQPPTPGAPAPVPLFSAATVRSFTPADNPVTDAKAKLGDMIFDEKRVSADNSIACNTCHSPRNGFTTHTATSRGVGDQLGKRNAPSILNAMFYKSMFWDGRAETLEEQSTLPILNPVEMGQKDPKDVVAKLAAIPEFVDAFQQVFSHPVNWEDMGKALAAFERTRLSTQAPFDRFLQGDEKALNASQRRGWALFTGKARCASCHSYDAPLPLFGDNRFHNTGVAADKQDYNQLAAGAARSASSQAEKDRLALETDFSELGRFLVTQKKEDIGAFKTPFLRDVLLTAPYMHDGSQETLWNVVEFFNKGGERNPFLDAEMKPLGLTESEVDDVVNFLGALTSDRFAEQRAAELDRQRTTYLYRRAVQHDRHKGAQ
ncbi:MAG TPA: cytochrome c peroxidase [Candidatus Acidoferrum sp.]|nr:cytochrome c peroxidase [Candidatus Acidoferrum sp.]